MPDIEYWEMKNYRAMWQIFYGCVGFFVGIVYVIAQWVPFPMPYALGAFVSPASAAAIPAVTSGDFLTSGLIAVMIVLWSGSQIDEGLVTRRYYKKLIAKTTELKNETMGITT